MSAQFAIIQMNYIGMAALILDNFCQVKLTADCLV